MTESVTESASDTGERAQPFPSGWREDIAGLRGVAVLLVVLYHAGVPGFSGGYVGVDVFFALSGYLITGILVAEARARGRIDLPRFYARRARRLLPAAFVLLAGVAAVGMVTYGPLQQAELAKSAVAAALYASNVLFGLRATDYLAAEAHADPLLHTWSLAVEEQFYLVWPALLIALLFGWRGFLSTRKKPPRAPLPTPHTASPRPERRAAWGLAALALASFALAVGWMETERAHWAFFSPFSRAWEFALGGLAALVPLRSGRGARWTDALGWTGLVAVVAAGVVYTDLTPFPGVAALLPVVGTVLVLRAGARDAEASASRMLGVRPLRWLGALSYAWYLWHWPALVVGAALLGEVGLGARLALAAASLAPAWVSYRLVEEPIRRSRRLGARASNGLAVLVVTTAASALVAFGWLGFARSELGASAQERYAAARADLPDLYARGCHDDFPATTPAACTDAPASTAADSASATVALFGDSHAAQWAPALQEIAGPSGWRLVYLTKSSCPGVAAPLYQRGLGRVYTECDAWRAAALDTLRALRPDLVLFTFDTDYPLADRAWQSGIEEAVADLVAASGAVVVLGDTPRAPHDVPYCLARRAWHERLGIGTGRACTFSAAEGNREANAALREAATQAHTTATFVDLTDAVCPGGLCAAEADGRVHYRDDHHLTATYASSLADALAPHLDRALSPRQTARAE